MLAAPPMWTRPAANTVPATLACDRRMTDPSITKITRSGGNPSRTIRAARPSSILPRMLTITASVAAVPASVSVLEEPR